MTLPLASRAPVMRTVYVLEKASDVLGVTINVLVGASKPVVAGTEPLGPVSSTEMEPLMTGSLNLADTNEPAGTLF